VNFIKSNEWLYTIDTRRKNLKKSTNGTIRLHKKLMQLADNTFIIEDIILYPLTPGLTSLIFSKNPNSHTENDLQIYKFIFIYTSAHLRSSGTSIRKFEKSTLK